jgi:hypothetical protein
VFGRLAYLASLREPNTGAYEHHGLAQVFGSEEAGWTLRQSHAQVFEEWLGFPLERQKQDLESYLAGLEGAVAAVLANWARLAPYRGYLPADAIQAERELFLTDLETVLELLRYDYGVVSRDPDS